MNTILKIAAVLLFSTAGTAAFAQSNNTLPPNNGTTDPQNSTPLTPKTQDDNLNNKSPYDNTRNGNNTVPTDQYGIPGTTGNPGTVGPTGSYPVSPNNPTNPLPPTNQTNPATPPQPAVPTVPYNPNSPQQ